MTIRITLKQIGDLVELCKFVGAAPCQILSINRATREEQLLGREIIVPVSLAALVRPVPS